MEYLTITHVATMLNVNRMTIYRWIKLGKLEATQFGKLYRINREALDRFIEKYSNK